jgi:hypothetical protein
MAAGQTFLVAKGLAYWAPAFDANATTTKWPSLSAGYGDDAAWTAAGFSRIMDTVNGIGLTFRNPRVAVNSEERGRLGQVAGGDEGVTIGMQLVSIEMPLLEKLSALVKATQTATTHVETLTLSAGLASNVQQSVTLNGVTYTTTGATSASQGTSANLATYMRTAANYTPAIPSTGATGWTIGGTGNDVVFTAASSGARGGTYTFAPGGGAAGTLTATTVGYGSTDFYHLDKNANMSFAIGIEGIAPAGTLYATRRYIRGIAYHVEQTANVEHRMAHTAIDAVFRPNATLECQPAVEIPSTTLTGTGVSATSLDPNRRFDYAFIDAPES